MQPTFKEKEENGIYTATLDGVTDNGVSINETWKMNIESIKENEILRCSQLGFSMDAIIVHLKEFILNYKTEGIDILKNRFNEKVAIVLKH